MTRRMPSTPPLRCCAPRAPAAAPRPGIEQAIYAYNHAQWYVTEVMTWAAKYAAQGGGEPASTVAAEAITFAKQQIGKPYQWGAAGRTLTTAQAWSTPPTPPRASTSPARPTSGSKTARPCRCPRSSPATCCSPPAATAPPGNPGHVVMYLGGGQVIQAPQIGQDVQIDPLDLASIVVATRPDALASHP